ncbi:unnamed protein product [Heterobilharzia americana]|nr:unnamed protein product [Heterobilharzia americana]
MDGWMKRAEKIWISTPMMIYDLCLFSQTRRSVSEKQQVDRGLSAAKTGLDSSEHRKDGGDEDTQPTTTLTEIKTRGTNHHERERPKPSSLSHLRRQHRFNCRWWHR